MTMPWLPSPVSTVNSAPESRPSIFARSAAVARTAGEAWAPIRTDIAARPPADSVAGGGS